MKSWFHMRVSGLEVEWSRVHDVRAIMMLHLAVIDMKLVCPTHVCIQAASRVIYCTDVYKSTRYQACVKHAIHIESVPRTCVNQRLSICRVIFICLIDMWEPRVNDIDPRRVRSRAGTSLPLSLCPLSSAKLVGSELIDEDNVMSGPIEVHLRLCYLSLICKQLTDRWVYSVLSGESRPLSITRHQLRSSVLSWNIYQQQGSQAWNM